MCTQRVLITLLIGSAYALGQNPPPSLTTLYSFTGGADGANPHARLVPGSNGVLYGTTFGGGATNNGTVFSLTPPVSPGGAWTENAIYSFQGGASGFQPEATLAIDNSGVLYGTASALGNGIVGVIYSLTPPASSGGAWTQTVLHSFGGTGYGGGSKGGLVLGPAGVLYGTTQYGGGSNVGTVFALAPPTTVGGAWTYSVLYSFKNGGDGNYPTAGLAIGGGTPNKIVLYGTTAAGGSAGAGTVFSLTPPLSAGNPWTEAVLHSFTGGADGAQPSTGLVLGNDIYGTTFGGGASNTGTIFSLSFGSWTETVLRSFPGSPSQLPFPGRLVFRGTGLLGTTQNGGVPGAGTAYMLKPPASPGGSWTVVPLHIFTGGADGANPTGLTPSSGGIFYGTTIGGGTYGYGTVFALQL